MADTAIFDLTAETALTAAHEFVTQDTSAATPSQAATFALMGGLEYVTSGDAAISAAVGKFYYVDVGSFTADRVLTLPATAAVGERIGVFVSTGDDTYELGIQANTGDTLNGVAAATDWSRLFITNECIIMRCVVANTTWVVEYDGRITCTTKITPATNVTTNSAATWTPVDLASAAVDYDVGNLADTANDRFLVRRANKYSIMCSGRPVASVTDAQYWGIGWNDDSGADVIHQTTYLWPATGNTMYCTNYSEESLTTSDFVYPKFRSQASNRGYDTTETAASISQLSYWIVTEIF